MGTCKYLTTQCGRLVTAKKKKSRKASLALSMVSKTPVELKDSSLLSLVVFTVSGSPSLKGHLDITPWTASYWRARIIGRSLGNDVQN